MSSSLSGRMTCLGIAVIVFRLKSYCVTYEIALLARMRCMRSTALISISFAFRSWGKDCINLNNLLPGLVVRVRRLFSISSDYHILERLEGS